MSYITNLISQSSETDDDVKSRIHAALSVSIFSNEVELRAFIAGKSRDEITSSFSRHGNFLSKSDAFVLAKMLVPVTKRKIVVL
jgi:hypothetical protein